MFSKRGGTLHSQGRFLQTIVLEISWSEPKWNFVRPRWDSNPQSPAPEADALSIRPLGHHRNNFLTTSSYAMSSSCPAPTLRGLATVSMYFWEPPQQRQHAPAPFCTLGLDFSPTLWCVCAGSPLPARGSACLACGESVICLLDFLEGFLLWLRVTRGWGTLSKIPLTVIPRSNFIYLGGRSVCIL